MKKIIFGTIATVIAIAIALLSIFTNKKDNSLTTVRLADTTLTSRTYRS